MFKRPSPPAIHVLVLITALIFLAGLAASARADEEKKEEKKELVVGKWYPSLETGLNFSQGSYSNNWAGGSQSSVVWTLIANGSLESRINTKADWRNTLKLAYGQTHQQTSGTGGARTWESPQKSTDLIDFESLLRLTLGGFVDPFASFAYQSQFQDAGDPRGRKLALNPMQFKETAGIARKFMDSEDQALLSRLGFAFRQNLRRNFSDSVSSVTNSSMTNDGGFEWVTDYKAKVLHKRISWSSKLTVYQPVFYSGKSELKGLSAAYLESNHIDRDVASLSTQVSADWENIFSSQITKIISVSLYTRWIYDAYDNSVKPAAAAAQPPEAMGGALTNPQDVGAAVRRAGQFKETLSVGITYRFL